MAGRHALGIVDQTLAALAEDQLGYFDPELLAHAFEFRTRLFEVTLRARAYLLVALDCADHRVESQL